MLAVSSHRTRRFSPAFNRTTLGSNTHPAPGRSNTIEHDSANTEATNETTAVDPFTRRSFVPLIPAALLIAFLRHAGVWSSS
jgi:hypothetical protein